jgi:hypothetical protein
MFAKKEPSSSSSNRGYRKELDYLYARKSAIDALIESLEDYDRFRAKPSSNRKLKMA